MARKAAVKNTRASLDGDVSCVVVVDIFCPLSPYVVRLAALFCGAHYAPFYEPSLRAQFALAQRSFVALRAPQDDKPDSGLLSRGALRAPVEHQMTRSAGDWKSSLPHCFDIPGLLVSSDADLRMKTPVPSSCGESHMRCRGSSWPSA